MEQDIAFGRCVDFLARMIEKYGQELLDEINATADEEAENRAENAESAQMGVGNGIHFLYFVYIEKLKINGIIKLGQIIETVI